jgi:hypothetical protein
MILCTTKADVFLVRTDASILKLSPPLLSCSFFIFSPKFHTRGEYLLTCIRARVGLNPFGNLVNDVCIANRHQALRPVSCRMLLSGGTVPTVALILWRHLRYCPNEGTYFLSTLRVIKFRSGQGSIGKCRWCGLPDCPGTQAVRYCLHDRTNKMHREIACPKPMTSLEMGKFAGYDQ